MGDSGKDAPMLPCEGKLALDTKKQAVAAATTAEYQHGTKLKVYHCRHCHLWHLSTADATTLY